MNTDTSLVLTLLLRALLLGGLIAHKALWEIMKRGPSPRGGAKAAPVTLFARAVKGVKLLILLGIIVQTVLPDGWLPVRYFLIAGDATGVRLAGTVLYAVGLAVAMLGRLQLGSNWEDIEKATVLREQRVVDHGLYAYIRHPIYVGDLLLLFGLQLALNSVLVFGVVLLTPIVLRQAVREEAMLARTLAGYPEYQARTKRFIPYVA